MVIAQLYGGLGNQLFIYATARAVALRNRTQLVLDVKSGFQYDHHFRRQFMLHHFNVQYLPASRLDPFTQPNRIGWALWAAARRLDRYVDIPRRLRFYITERQHEDMQELLRHEMPRRVYLDGFWQKEVYFKEYEEQIRSELTIRAPIGQQSIEIANEIAQSDSIAVHSRRLHQARAGHGPDLKIRSLPPEYYTKAIRTIAERVKRPHLFCFSDCPEWAMKNSRTELPTTLVTHNAGDPRSYEDLWLMTKCKHHVIANSTFSWWGAWLCNHVEKVVISPDPSHWGQIMDIPSGWLIVRDF